MRSSQGTVRDSAPAPKVKARRKPTVTTVTAGLAVMELHHGFGRLVKDANGQPVKGAKAVRGYRAATVQLHAETA